MSVYKYLCINIYVFIKNITKQIRGKENCGNTLPLKCEKYVGQQLPPI